MHLCALPVPQLCNCAKKVFLTEEYHITRRSEHSVLILMTERVLYFSEDGAETALEAGEYYIQREGLWQTASRPSGGAEYYYFGFYGTYADSPGGGGLPLRGHYDPSVILPLAQQCCRQFFSPRSDPFAREADLLRILSYLRAADSPRDSRESLLSRLHDYLEANYTSHGVLRSAAVHFGYSADYTNRIFRETYGQTPHAYIESLRMQNARWLLAHTDFSVQSIAERVGYAEFSSFWRGFVRTYGVTPSAVRRKEGESP